MRLRYGSQERLRIRSHDFFDAARYAASILDEPGHIEIAALVIELEHFERGVQAKLMPILPAIGDTFFWVVDANGSVVNSAILDALTPCSTWKPKCANRRIVQRRMFDSTGQRHINCMWHLSRELVKRVRPYCRPPSVDSRNRKSAGNSTKFHVPLAGQAVRL